MAEVPSGWSKRTVADFCTRSRHVNVDGTDHPPLSVTKDRGVVLQSEKYNKRIATDPRKYVIARAGQFAFDPMSLYYGAIGRVGVEVGLISPDYVAFDADDSVDADFLNYFLRAPQQVQAYERVAETGNQFGKRRRVYWSVFEQLDLVLPPLPEQSRIATILSSLDAVIEKTEAVIEQLEVVRTALTHELLARGLPGRHTRFKQTEAGEVPEEWEVATLGSVATLVTSGSRGWAQYYADSGALFVRITNLSRESIELDLRDTKRVALPAGLSEGTRTRLEPNDVLVSITADLGIVGIVRDGLGEAYINQHIALVRLDPGRVYPAFVARYLASDAGQERLWRLNDAGAKAGLNLPSIRAVPIAIPPRPEQRQIDGHLAAFDARTMRERETLSRLQETKRALLSVLLTGEVRVTPDEDAA